MTEHVVPRVVTSVLVDNDGDGVTVSWGLGEQVSSSVPEYFGYGMYYYDPTGSGGKRFGVRFGSEVTAWVFDHDSSTQANYLAESVTISDDSVIVRYRDASIGLDEIGTIAA